MKAKTAWIILGTMAITMTLMMAVTGLALASDQIMTIKTDQMTVATDKNGQPYTRFIVQQTATLNGHSYSYGVPLMAFGELHEKAQSLTPGAEIRVIANHRKMADGRESYTIRAFLD